MKLVLSVKEANICMLMHFLPPHTKDFNELKLLQYHDYMLWNKEEMIVRESRWI